MNSNIEDYIVDIGLAEYSELEEERGDIEGLTDDRHLEWARQ